MLHRGHSRLDQALTGRKRMTYRRFVRGCIGAYSHENVGAAYAPVRNLSQMIIVNVNVNYIGHRTPATFPLWDFMCVSEGKSKAVHN